MRIASLLLSMMLVFAGSMAFAKSWKFECDGAKRSLAITPSTGEYPLQAIYRTSSASIKLVGDKDFERDYEGFLIDIIRLIDPANFNYQVVIEYTESIGATVWAKQVDTQSGDSEDFQCTLVSFKR
jgi:hypothetical protein